ncbi:RagB/SusD family nutrient uptake outer membrane protein [Deminuibacter soli]|uniref:RagB/SusD family nutrient uptake outer membrane protein n=1 Tax=Deminuibacter soli TaxID=2291815 RepID=A0A3E1NFH9_9BACT|nr:RagB/SusD family nutrient uptake outer membrane protein [Deminuibacter soli]RFM26627.1 RagB/SusD family nutrient uptake outer membrane protein [Deminuibacter soli]
MVKHIFITAAVACAFASCKKDFISLTPQDQPSSATFFQTEAQFRQGIIAAYTPLRDLMNNDFFTAEMRSDNTHYEYYSINRGTAYQYKENIADFVDEAIDDVSNAVYFAPYKGIVKTNIVIGRIGAANISDTARKSIEGQARFLRAFYYFKLVRYFGGVPLYLKESTNADDAFIGRSTADQVYDQIITDAKTAIDLLQPPAKFPQSGEATKGAATMLLADVYMTLKKYPEAEALLKTLPGMGYTLLPDYASVFSTSNKNSRESIFEVQYLQGLQGGQQSNFIYLFLPRCKSTALITYGVATNNTGTGGWNTPTTDMINAYEPNDKRKDVSIGVAEGVYDASCVFTLSAYKSILNYKPATGKTGVPFIKKYLNPHTNVNNTDDNWPVYRYADALLLLAEAQNAQGRPADALANLNMVRTRAGLPAATEMDQTNLADIIAHERRVELAFENKRWHDLVRTGKAIEVMNADGVRLKQQYSYLSPASYNVTTSKLLYPIPKSEILTNPKLTQNPDYN